MKVTLVVPVYDGTRYLAQAISSALAQSRAPDEILVVDDGSTDAPEAILRSFGSAVRHLRQERRGTPAARNRGIDASDGDLITFLDHDDMLTPDSIELRVNALLREPELGCVHGTVEQFISPELTPAEREVLPARLPTVNGRVPGATMFRREMFDRVGRFDETVTIGYMIDWVSRAQAAAVAIGSIPDVVLRRRVHATNSVHDVQALEAHYLRALRTAVRRRKVAASTQ